MIQIKSLPVTICGPNANAFSELVQNKHPQDQRGAQVEEQFYTTLLILMVVPYYTSAGTSTVPN